ncbi:MAG TPA: hypothetical protein VKO18_13425 [Terriglobia bacterium]|nr:hypothetical protein [Terriglobia bacterium]
MAFPGSAYQGERLLGDGPRRLAILLLDSGDDRNEFVQYHADTEGKAMNEFIAKFGDQITGVLSGFDRLVPRGSLRAILLRTGDGGLLEW